jgi:hypothetical protein
VYSTDFQFPCGGQFDTFAMGLVVHFMGTHRHLVQELCNNQDGADSVVPKAEVDQFCQQFSKQRLNTSTVFKMILVSGLPFLWIFFALSVHYCSFSR